MDSLDALAGQGPQRSEDYTKKIVAIYSPQLVDMTKGRRTKEIVDLAHIKAIGTPLLGFPVVRPFDAYRYDIRQKHVRRRQARVAQTYGIDAFAYQHVWRRKLGGEAPGKGDTLDLLLQDGEPNIDFCIMWLTKSHTERPLWMETEAWRPHFDYLLPYLKNPRYLTSSDGRPLLVVTRLDVIGGQMATMLAQWQVWATEAGLKGLLVVQSTDAELYVGAPAYKKNEGAAAMMEWVTNPHADTIDGWHAGTNSSSSGSQPSGPSAAVTTAAARHHVSSMGDPETQLGLPRELYFRGVSTSYNNRARVLDGAQPLLHPAHPTAFRTSLRAKLAATPPGGMVFVNSWNNWGEGMALEASNEFGLLWLEAVLRARNDDKERAPFPDVPAAGLAPPSPHVQNTDNTMCLLVRTFDGHDDGAMFSFRDFLMTTLRQENENLIVYVFNTDTQPFPRIETIIRESRAELAALGVKSSVRVEVVAAPVERTYSAYYSSYDVTDWVIQEKVTKEGSPCAYFTVTNGDNFYSRDAFNAMPAPEENMLLMNFYGRYSLVNSVIYGHSTSPTKEESNTKSPPPACCDRLQGYGCMDAMPAIGYVDLGAVIFKVLDWRLAQLAFTKFNGACKYNSCHDGALVSYVVNDLGWTHGQHLPGQCAFLHNPNPESCRLVGGYYWDATTYHAAGCYPSPSATGVSELEIDWPKFVANDGCVCRSPLEHFQRTGMAGLTQPLNQHNFDVEDYLKRYPDVAKKYGKADPYKVWLHYDKTGITEGRVAQKKLGS